MQCKHMQMDFEDGDDGVPVAKTILGGKCFELMKENKEDINDIFEDWVCPEFEQKD